MGVTRYFEMPRGNLHIIGNRAGEYHVRMACHGLCTIESAVLSEDTVVIGVSQKDECMMGAGRCPACPLMEITKEVADG